MSVRSTGNVPRLAGVGDGGDLGVLALGPAAAVLAGDAAGGDDADAVFGCHGKGPFYRAGMVGIRRLCGNGFQVFRGLYSAKWVCGAMWEGRYGLIMGAGMAILVRNGKNYYQLQRFCPTNFVEWGLFMKGFSIYTGFVITAIVFLTSARLGAHQAIYFMPQVPDPDAMVIDGREDDWGWFDPVFAITPDIMWEILNGLSAVLPKDDWNCVLYVAWSSIPDNSLYYFARVEDDSLGIFVENPHEYWKDDSLEIIVDADHSGENFNETQMTSGQQYGIRVLPAGQKDTWLYNIPQESLLWSTEEPFFIYEWTLDPPDAKPLEQPVGSSVTYTYEVKQAVWTFHDKTGPDGSQRHIFGSDQIIGLTFAFDETENPEFGRESYITTTPVLGAFQDNSRGSDFITIPTEGATGGFGPSAVKKKTWGTIKAFMAR